MKNDMNYLPIIGLEVHVELKTKSKMFCRCSADYFGQAPNTHTCPVCLGLPGALPVPNKKAIEWCIKIALALNCEINQFSKFDRKNYFYPDLPKGYQISQYDLPFGEHGSMTLSNGTTIGITRVHMEEDTGKLTHAGGSSLVDYNRSGVPLVEIVTEPDFHNAKDVKEYLQRLQQIVRYLDVSNADMEKGDMRLEPNISLQKVGEKKNLDEVIASFSEREQKILEALYVCEKNNMSRAVVAKMFAVSQERIKELETRVKKKLSPLPSYKVEVKNINSFSFVEKAITYEIDRQATILNERKTPVQETRGWNETKNATVSQRVKEEANDYRYFPEPDIPPILMTKDQISRLRSEVPELPDKKIVRFIDEYNLSSYDAEILTREKPQADLFEELTKKAKEFSLTPKQIANALINKKISFENTSIEEAIKQIAESNKKDVVDPAELENAIQSVLQENSKAVSDYKSGKETVIMFLVGMSIKKLGKKVDATLVKEALIEKLK